MGVIFCVKKIKAWSSAQIDKTNMKLKNLLDYVKDVLLKIVTYMHFQKVVLYIQSDDQAGP